MQSFEYRYIITHLRKIAGACKTGRAGTDHGNLAAVFRLCTHRFDVVLKRVIRHEPLQFSDGDRLALDAPDAFALALGLLRTDTAADRRKRAGFSDHLIGLFNVSFFYFMDKCRDIDGYRTSLDAFCILAVEASFRLFHCLFFVVTEADFIKICRTDLRILLPYRYFFQHISHYSSPPQCPHPP